eukprot:scaffold290055_cov19-Tisochrysis_lutea.AAC.1
MGDKRQGTGNGLVCKEEAVAPEISNYLNCLKLMRKVESPVIGHDSVIDKKGCKVLSHVSGVSNVGCQSAEPWLWKMLSANRKT